MAPRPKPAPPASAPTDPAFAGRRAGECRADGKPVWSGHENKAAYLARVAEWEANQTAAVPSTSEEST